MVFILYKQTIRKGYVEDDGSDLRKEEDKFYLVCNEPQWGPADPETGEQEPLPSEEEILKEWYGEECQNQDYSYSITLTKIAVLSYDDVNNLYKLFETDKIKALITKIREVI